MTHSVPVGEVRRLGDRAFLIGADGPEAARSLARALQVALGDGDGEVGGGGEDSGGVVELVCGFATVAVLVTDPEVELDALQAAARRVAAAFGGHEDIGKGSGRLVTVPCAFDGPDLAAVAVSAGCTEHEVAEYLTQRPLSVAVVGFSPGFAYLDGLPEPLRAVRRHDRPRPVVPAGSVALANGHAAVYPTASPGGWQLVGRTGIALFSAESPPYAVLAPGDRVRLTVAGPGEADQPEPTPAPAWSPPPGARPVLEVMAPGLRAVVQDGGRRGVAAAGVPRAGPADPFSFLLANALVGNPQDSGTIELTGGGTRLRGLGPSHVAVVGASPQVRIDGTEVSAGHVLSLDAGQVLEVGPLRRGCRTYLSVAGGIVGPSAFGSRSSDELCGLGPGPLARAQLLYAGPWAPPLGGHLRPGTATEVQESSAPLELRVVPGPHAERFGPHALARLAGVEFSVEGDSNRVGIRLRDPAAAGMLRWSAGERGELDSQGVVTGAVQVPPGGDPVILMPDHATLGGYPVLAVVVWADLGRLGQCAPGARVRLVPIGHDEADSAARELRRTLESAVIGPYPLSAG